MKLGDIYALAHIRGAKPSKRLKTYLFLARFMSIEGRNAAYRFITEDLRRRTGTNR